MEVGLNSHQFEKYINAVIEYDTNTRKFEAVMELGFQDFFGICRIGQEILNPYMDLVKELMHDEGDWIDYWIYELENGNKYADGCVTDNGVNIKLKTAEDLYRFLIKNAQED